MNLQKWLRFFRSSAKLGIPVRMSGPFRYLARYYGEPYGRVLAFADFITDPTVDTPSVRDAIAHISPLCAAGVSALCHVPVAERHLVDLRRFCFDPPGVKSSK